LRAYLAVHSLAFFSKVIGSFNRRVAFSFSVGLSGLGLENKVATITKTKNFLNKNII